MQVEQNELVFINKNRPAALCTTVANRLIAKGRKVTKHKVVNEITRYKKEYDKEIIDEVREVLHFMTGKSYNGQVE